MLFALFYWALGLFFFLVHALVPLLLLAGCFILLRWLFRH